VPVPQLNRPVDLFSDVIRPDQDTSPLVVAQAANTPERSLWLVMQGLWRVNAAWTGDRDIWPDDLACMPRQPRGSAECHAARSNSNSGASGK
jgi:hypothetical protein